MSYLTRKMRRAGLCMRDSLGEMISLTRFVYFIEPEMHVCTLPALFVFCRYGYNPHAGNITNYV